MQSHTASIDTLLLPLWGIPRMGTRMGTCPPPPHVWERSRELQMLMTPLSLHPPGLQFCPFYYPHQHLPPSPLCSLLLLWWLQSQPSVSHFLLPCPSCLVASRVPSASKTEAHVPCALRSTPRMGGKRSIRDVRGWVGGCSVEHKPQTLRTTEVHPCGIPSPGSCRDPSVFLHRAAQIPGRHNCFQPSCLEICWRWPQ